MTSKYILNDQGNPAAEPDLMKWAKWFETCNWCVACDQVGKSRISTVFLGLNYNHLSNEPPILWETMVFDGPLDEECTRCSGSREQAEAMHARMVERVKQNP